MCGIASLRRLNRLAVISGTTFVRPVTFPRPYPRRTRPRWLGLSAAGGQDQVEGVATPAWRASERRREWREGAEKRAAVYHSST